MIYGTTGELIKLLPVLARFRDRDIQFMTVTTGQQAAQIPPLLDSFNLPQPDVWLARGAGGKDLRKNSEVPAWAARVVANFARRARGIRRRMRSSPTRPLVLVHGDTMTTALGAAMGRVMRMPVAHIEAGMRSFDLRHPFPEEMNRRVTSVIANIHYAPGPQAAGNLRGGTIVDTGSNTILDSLGMFLGKDGPGVDVPDRPFGLISLHRFELINNRPLFTATVRALAEHMERHPMLFIDHPVTGAAIERYGLAGLFDSHGLVRIKRLLFAQFIELEKRSAFVVTDSGGSQEETFFMDIPCLIHRRKTEHAEGVGENVVVSGYDIAVLDRFLADPSAHRRVHALPEQSPSEIIVEDLVARGFA